jgi:hypothetical protein
MNRQFFLGPLQSIDAQGMKGPVIVIIDTLNECGDSISRESLLALF